MMTFDAGEIHGQHHISAKMVELAGIVALLHALPQNLAFFPGEDKVVRS
jgi:hypothetical protein